MNKIRECESQGGRNQHNPLDVILLQALLCIAACLLVSLDVLIGAVGEVFCFHSV